jgi:PBP1b-binding outer membrane lipoprotein LpoB
MSQLLRLLALAFIMVLAACTTAPTKDIKVDAEADPKASFSGFKTYAWLASAQILFDPEGQWEPRNVDIDAEVQSIINSELRKRGIAEVSSNPDMLVAFAAGVDMTTLGLKQNPETREKLIENIPSAALVVALIDADTGYVIWIGEAIGDVQQQADEATVRARIEYAIKEMFRLLPKN